MTRPSTSTGLAHTALMYLLYKPGHTTVTCLVWWDVGLTSTPAQSGLGLSTINKRAGSFCKRTVPWDKRRRHTCREKPASGFKRLLPSAAPSVAGSQFLVVPYFVFHVQVQSNYLCT